MPSVSLSKSDIVAQARALGAELVGLAPIDRWNDLAEVPANRRPQAIWPRTRTVIVLGVPLWLPVVEAAPSQLGREQIIVTDKLLEEAAYRLSVFLNERGHAAINVPRNSEDEPDSPDEVYASMGNYVFTTDVLLDATDPRMAKVSPDMSDEFMRDVLIGTST